MRNSDSGVPGAGRWHRWYGCGADGCVSKLSGQTRALRAPAGAWPEVFGVLVLWISEALSSTERLRDVRLACRSLVTAGDCRPADQDFDQWRNFAGA